jgi:hypothetical protein
MLFMKHYIDIEASKFDTEPRLIDRVVVNIALGIGCILLLISIPFAWLAEKNLRK